MITARNYAANAAKAFIDLKDVVKDQHWIESINHCMSKAVHFVLPDGGKIFDDKFKGLYGLPFKLPYNNLTIEYLSSDKTKSCILVTGYGSTIGIHLAVAEKDIWGVVPCCALIHHTPDVFTLDEIITRVQYKCLPIGKQPSEDIQRIAVQGVASSLGRLFELLEALSCYNVSMANYQDQSPSNDKRIKAGKIPIYETKMLVVNTSYVSGKSVSRDGSHASPRQHLRRGHIRRLEGRNIWVNACVVGDATKGVINKQYQIING